MSNKPLRITNAVLLHLGIILTIEGDMGMIKSHLLGSTLAQGVVNTYETTGKMAEQHAHIANWNLAVGIALILMGFAMHAWMTQRENRPVKVHVKKKPSNKTSWFWM